MCCTGIQGRKNNTNKWQEYKKKVFKNLIHDFKFVVNYLNGFHGLEWHILEVQQFNLWIKEPTERMRQVIFHFLKTPKATIISYSNSLVCHWILNRRKRVIILLQEILQIITIISTVLHLPVNSTTEFQQIITIYSHTLSNISESSKPWFSMKNSTAAESQMLIHAILTMIQGQNMIETYPKWFQQHSFQDSI